MGAVDGVTWHTPTAADFEELYGSPLQDGNPNGAKRLGAWANGSFTPLSGYAFGPNHNSVTLDGNTRVTNADPYINGAVFWPASGYRLWENGAVYWIGSAGYSWSATASASANGYRLAFNSTTISPQYNNPRPYGFPVRCIRD